MQNRYHRTTLATVTQHVIVGKGIVSTISIFDVVVPCLFRYDGETKTIYGASIDNGLSSPSFLIPMEGSKDHFVCGIERTLVVLRWDGVSKIATFERNATSVERDSIYKTNAFDKAKVDPKGRLYAGTYRQDFCPASPNPDGALYLFEKNRNILTVLKDIKSLQGVWFNKKKKLAYTIDYCTNYISEYDWSPHSGRFSKIV